ncbi:MAG: hypothetical protein MI739_11005 [Bacteroidales bacterium]|nr:hypothetical protein [Bacteroidales bacterium]
MKLKKIQTLLEKYYNGQSSLEEEEELKKYFDNENIDSRFIVDRDIFLYKRELQNDIAETPDLSDQIWAQIKNSKEQTNKKPRLNYLILKIAAGIVIILSIYFFTKNQSIIKKTEIQFADTYDSPSEAYEKTKKTLLYVSQLLNKGTKHLESIQKLETGVDKLNSIASFNRGIEKLEPITKYNIADKYIK